MLVQTFKSQAASAFALWGAHHQVSLRESLWRGIVWRRRNSGTAWRKRGLAVWCVQGAQPFVIPIKIQGMQGASILQPMQSLYICPRLPST